MTAIQSLKKLIKYLQDKLTEDKYFINYKSTTDPNEFERAIPTIYMLTMPSSDIIDGYPARCPAIVLTLEGRDEESYTVAAHLCVSCASISEQEIARPDDKLPNIYNVGEGEGYNTVSDEDLLTMGILFTDQISNYLYNSLELSISDISVEYPTADLEDFPYAISTITFKLITNKAKINQTISLHDFY